MPSTLLQIVQAASRRAGAAETPSAAFQNPSQDIQLLVSLADETGRSLSEEYQWQVLVKEKTFAALAAEDQGDITVIADGFNYILNETIWNRTLQWPIYGALDPQTWQAIKGSFPAYPYSEYRIRGNRLLMLPAPTAGHTMAFEYVSRFWIQSLNQDRFMSDTDIAVFDDELMITGVAWRLRRAKDMSYEALLSEYARRLEHLTSKDGGNRAISTSHQRRHGVNVQPGNWLV